jgi:dipeptidase
MPEVKLKQNDLSRLRPPRIAVERERGGVGQRPVGLTVSTMMRHLRDHFDGRLTHIPDNSEDHSRPRSICLHPEPWANGGTAASMVVDLTAARRRPAIAWCSMAPPCTGAFIPIPVGNPLPDEWTIGSDIRDEGSVWWAMHNLSQAVDREYATLTPYLQQTWGAWEREMLATVETSPDSDGAALQARTQRLLEIQRSLMRELRPNAIGLG